MNNCREKKLEPGVFNRPIDPPHGPIGTKRAANLRDVSTLQLSPNRQLNSKGHTMHCWWNFHDRPLPLIVSRLTPSLRNFLFILVPVTAITLGVDQMPILHSGAPILARPGLAPP